MGVYYIEKRKKSIEWSAFRIFISDIQAWFCRSFFYDGEICNLEVFFFSVPFFPEIILFV